MERFYKALLSLANLFLVKWEDQQRYNKKVSNKFNKLLKDLRKKDI